MIKTCYFGGGCFWCTEAIFKNINGVISIYPGYMGGDTKNHGAYSTQQVEERIDFIVRTPWS